MSSPSKSLGSPTKRLRIYESDDEEPELGEVDQLKAELIELKKRVAGLDAELKDTKAENRALSVSVSRLLRQIGNRLDRF